MTRSKHCPANERIKRKFFQWLEDSEGYGTASIDMAAAAISRYEAFTDYRDFKRFRVEHARTFKAHLSEKVTGIHSKKPLSKATITSTLRHLKSFFLWLADKPGYRSRIKYSDAAYFTPLAQDERVASGRRTKPVPELDDIERVLRSMPTATEIQRRDQAVMAFVILSGGRDNAVASLQLKHIDIVGKTVSWDAREVRTKRAKSFTSKFFPVGPLPLEIVQNWVAYLVKDRGFTPGDPLFPATEVKLKIGAQSPALCLSRRHWQTTAPIRAIFKVAFSRAGLPYFNPHSFRSTIARLGEQMCRTPEEWKAWSQNLGHTSVMTTFSSYGQVPEHRQCEIMAGIGEVNDEDGLASDIAALLRTRRSRGG